jgi:hypothetical protein
MYLIQQEKIQQEKTLAHLTPPLVSKTTSLKRDLLLDAQRSARPMSDTSCDTRSRKKAPFWQCTVPLRRVTLASKRVCVRVEVCVIWACLCARARG